MNNKGADQTWGCCSHRAYAGFLMTWLICPLLIPILIELEASGKIKQHKKAHRLLGVYALFILAPLFSAIIKLARDGMSVIIELSETSQINR